MTPQESENSAAFGKDRGSVREAIYFLPNVPSDLSLLAFGIPPAREAESAGGMPKVPKGQGLGACAR